MNNSYSSTGRYPPESGATQAGTKEQAQHEAQRLAEKAKAQGQSLLAERKSATADEIGGVAEALRKASHEMDQQEHPPLITPYAERAAHSLEQFSHTLRERDVGTLMRQAEDFARRQPGVFIGGAVAAGFLLARFFRSSALHSEYDYVHPSQASEVGGARPAAGYGAATPGQGAPSAYTPPASGVGAGATTPPTGTESRTTTAGTTTSTQRKGEP
ncbi:hypothetical protein [Nitrosococcus wardiae]|uniref:DUF3618 domain-containing protein n=1 Tax=Nitrosococcus wardiae TaxID=1814290 RepID=A0A4P7C4A8_9GAMM|nr:hypothetical protein [Nitrosococcus wardiae]QBQ55756.1 hypothetical protein E3U44_15480 [Nitrosococcus wardiae]